MRAKYFFANRRSENSFSIVRLVAPIEIRNESDSYYYEGNYYRPRTYSDSGGDIFFRNSIKMINVTIPMAKFSVIF
jgi:hypothetical protein